MIMDILEQVIDIIEELYRKGWDERNGGNLSLIISEAEVAKYADPKQVMRSFTYDFDLSPLIGKYFIITGSGKYFRNVVKEPEVTLGIVKIVGEHQVNLVWGFETGAHPTSEAPTHFQCHIERLKVNPNHRLIIHCHPDYLIAMTHIHELDEKIWALDLWKMQTESLVVFPEGIGVLPWTLCGSEEIGVLTAEKMKEYRSVVWAQHGLFASGEDIDEVFGLIETIEKAAKIYMLTYDKQIKQEISNAQLLNLACAFNVTPKEGILE